MIFIETVNLCMFVKFDFLDLEHYCLGTPMLVIQFLSENVRIGYFITGPRISHIFRLIDTKRCTWSSNLTNFNAIRFGTKLQNIYPWN